MIVKETDRPTYQHKETRLEYVDCLNRDEYELSKHVSNLIGIFEKREIWKQTRSLFFFIDVLNSFSLLLREL